MKLTNRRKQFLEQVVQMYSETHEPIHYSDIAESIGVSKWTAYDILNELEKHQFLERTYTVNPNETGRSMVVYVPTSKSQKMFEQRRQHISSEEEWKRIRSDILRFVNETSVSENPLDHLFGNILPKVELKVELSAYFLSVLLVYLHKQGKTIKDLTINVINVSDAPAIQLSTFVGAVVGMIISSASERLGLQMIELVKQFMKSTEELTEQELQYLIDYVGEA